MIHSIHSSYTLSATPHLEIQSKIYINVYALDSYMMWNIMSKNLMEIIDYACELLRGTY